MVQVKQQLVGVSGLRVSEIGLGTATWGTRTDPSEAQALLRSFTDAGGTLVDTSPSYTGGRSQEMLGELLGRTGGTGGSAVSRDLLVLSSSAGVAPNLPVGQRVDCSRRALMRQLDHTLHTLGTDHLDLWSVGYWDDKTPPEEVADTLEWAIRSGRTRYAGVRDYAGWQLAVTNAATEKHAIVATQHEYSLLVRDIEEEVIPAATHLGIGVIATAPLAQGVLTGRYRGNVSHVARAEVHTLLGEKSDTVVDAVATAAKGLDLSPAVIALAWARGRPGVASTVVGASKPAQLNEVLRAVDAVLPRAIAQALDDVSR